MTITGAQVRAFFAQSDYLDYLMLRPLSHIASNWELTCDAEASEYKPESESFARHLNGVIREISETVPPKRYHDNEDRLAEFLVVNLNWPIKKVGGRWIGDDYDFILEQGGFSDADQKNLVEAATGRVYAALKRNQDSFDEMEEGHRRMLGAVMTILLYHRGNDTGYELL